jgi:ATP-dependent DNA ligase
MPFGDSLNMLQDIEETKSIGDCLRKMRTLSGKTAKTEYAKSWTTPAHHRFIDLVGNNKRQWFITWASVQACTDDIGDSAMLDEVFFAAETRAATPAMTAKKVRTLAREGYDRDYLKAVVEKTLDAGITVAAIKKAQGLTKHFSPSLAQSWTKMSEEKKRELLATGKYVSTPKMDGLRCIFKLHTADRGVYSRSLKPLYNMDHILTRLEQMIPVACHIDGEALAADRSWDSSMSGSKRQKGSDVEMHLYPFDLILREEIDAMRYEMPAEERHERLHAMIDWSEVDDVLRRVPETPVTSAEQVHALHLQAISEGWEGLVLHSLQAPYACKRSDAWIKVKAWQSAEFAVIGFQAGTGKHIGRLGALIVSGEYDGQKITSEVGTGFTDAMREHIWQHRPQVLGKWAEIKFFEATKDASLRFPSFLRFREDE